MENKNAQILIAATAIVGSFEIILYSKNLVTAYKMKVVPEAYAAMDKDEGFKTLRSETIRRCVYEIFGVVFNCSVLIAKIWFGYFPAIWELVTKTPEEWNFITYFAFSIVDSFLNKVFFLPVRMKVMKCRGSSAVKLKTLAKGHTPDGVPWGDATVIAIMIYTHYFSSKTTLFLIPITSKIHDFINEFAKVYRCKKLTHVLPDSSLTKALTNVAGIHNFNKERIYINDKDTEVAEANYYGLVQIIIISQKLLSLPEELVVTLISQEIGLHAQRRSWRNFVIPIVKNIGLGLLLSKCLENEDIIKIFGFDKPPHPSITLYLGYAYIWPVFYNILHRAQCLLHCWSVKKADAAIHFSTSNHGPTALKAVAGKDEKHPIFDSWYSQLIRGQPTVSQRIDYLNAPLNM